MIQHLLLALVAPPLLLLGMSEPAARRALRGPAARQSARMLGNPIVAWSAAMATLFVWHLPALYDAALTNMGVHVVEHLSVLVTATMFWWPVVSPLPETRLSPPLAVPYLFSACVASSLLGIIITGAPGELYSPYRYPHGGDAVSAMLHMGMGRRLTPAVDQQVGGLIMWVGCCIVYVVGIMLVLAYWYNTPDTDAAVPTSLAGRVLGGRGDAPVAAGSVERS